MKDPWVTVTSIDGSGFAAYVATPPSGRGPGIVLCQEIFGVNPDVRAMADRLAEEGYVVFVPDLYRRLSPRAEFGYGQDDVAEALELNRVFDDAGAVDDVGAAMQALKSHPAFIGQAAVMGFCQGGRISLLSAAAGHGDCVISFYGVGLEKSLDALRRIRVPVVAHFGQDDAFSPPETIEAVRDALSGSTRAEVYVYSGVGHGFALPGRPTFEPANGGMAYSRSIAALRRVLGPYYDLSALWEVHRACEFNTRDADATMATMVPEPYVNHVPTMTGGYGQTDLHRFYRDHFIPNNPKDMRNIPISRTVGADRVVNEGILSFTHDCEIEWMLPGVPPTGRFVEVALVGIITFRGDKLVHEHIYWDQATVLVQVGLLDPRGLPVRGADSARKVLHPELPANELMANWAAPSSPREPS